MQKVKITKLAAAKNPLHETPLFDEYEHGSYNDNLSIPVDYWVEGFLINDVTVGESVYVERTKRNGVKCPGIFRTSVVMEAGHDFFTTFNSVYKIEYLD